MHLNQMTNVIQSMQQNSIENEIESLKDSIKAIKENRMNLIELEVRQTKGAAPITTKVMINPNYIAYMEDNAVSPANTCVHMSDGTTLRALATKEEILELINKSNSCTGSCKGASKPTYIG